MNKIKWTRNNIKAVGHLDFFILFEVRKYKHICAFWNMKIYYR